MTIIIFNLAGMIGAGIGVGMYTHSWWLGFAVTCIVRQLTPYKPTS